MQAVIRSGSTQYLIIPGQVIDIDLVSDAAKTLTFEPLLVIDGDRITVGTPTVTGITVTAELLGEIKGGKLKILKFQSKKRVKKLTGHRQHYTQVKITAIGSAKAPAEKKAATPKPAAKKVPTAKAAVTT